jgi:hypothetical protein
VALCFLLACTLLPLAPSTAAAGDTIRVDADTGNDVSGNGTLVAPYATIGKALSVATSEDMIRVAPGDYYPKGIP